jgi:hypothetical protein
MWCADDACCGAAVAVWQGEVGCADLDAIQIGTYGCWLVCAYGVCSAAALTQQLFVCICHMLWVVPYKLWCSAVAIYANALTWKGAKIHIPP